MTSTRGKRIYEVYIFPQKIAKNTLMLSTTRILSYLVKVHHMTYLRIDYLQKDIS